MQIRKYFYHGEQVKAIAEDELAGVIEIEFSDGERKVIPSSALVMKIDES